ncbi:MAG: T9SS type A sorting domain-containing protein [Crocinitomicaceae bacterium]
MKHFLIILFSIISLGGHAQFWIQKSSFGGVGRHRAVGCATENKGYLGLGHVNGTGVDISYKDWWEYDPASDSWSQKANFPVNNHGATSFVVNDQPCVGGGSALAGEFFTFNPDLNTWTPIAPCPFFNPGDTQGFSVNNKGYVYLGTQLAEYDPLTNSWESKSPAPMSFGSWTCSFTIEGSGYVKAGNKLFEYKPAHNTWTQRANFPGLSSGGSSGFSILQRGFVTCGYVGGLSTVTDQVWSYYPGTNTWQMELEFPGISRRFPVAFAIHNRGYFGTGTNGINLNDFWQFNPTLNTIGMTELETFEIKAYPNPCVTNLHIQFEGELEPYSMGELHDLNGVLVMRFPLSSGLNEIDVQSIPRGIYILSARHNGTMRKLKINLI